MTLFFTNTGRFVCRGESQRHPDRHEQHGQIEGSPARILLLCVKGTTSATKTITIIISLLLWSKNVTGCASIIHTIITTKCIRAGGGFWAALWSYPPLEGDFITEESKASFRNICKCGPQSLVNLIGGNVYKSQVLFWKRQKRTNKLNFSPLWVLWW